MATPAFNLILRSDPLSPEAKAYRDNVRAAGGSIGNAALRSYDRMIRALKTTGVWDKIAGMYSFVGVDQLAGCLGAVKAPVGQGVAINTGFVAGDYNAAGASAGLQGGTGKYINTGCLQSSYGLSLTQMGLFIYVKGYDPNGTSRHLIGSQAAPATGFAVAKTITGTTEGAYLGCNALATELVNSGSANLQGLLGACVNGSRSQQYYANGVAAGAANTAAGGLEIYNPVWIGSAGGGTPTTRLIRMGIVTLGMSATDVANLNTAVQQLMTDFGANV